MSRSDGQRWELTAGQLGIWFAQQLNPDDPFYNIAEYLEIHGDLDAELFEIALRHTINEVDAFHLRFTTDGEAPRQHVADPGDDWPVHVIDVSSAANPRAAAENWMRADLSRPADLRAGPVFAEALLRVGPGLFFWYQRVHHIALDGFSGAIIAARLAQVYDSLQAGSLPSARALEPVEALISADASYRASADFGRDREYWRAVLADFPDVPSVSGRQVPAVRRMPLRQTGNIGPGESERLRAASWRLRTTVGGLAVTAAAIYLHRSTGASDIVLGLPVLGRSGKQQRGIPGMTSNILPIRLTVSRTSSVADLAAQASAAIRSALRHQRYQLVDIRRDLGLTDGDASFSLIVNVMPFDYAVRFGNCSVVPHNLSLGPVDDIRISVYDRSADGSVQIDCNVNPELYDAASGRHILDRFRRVLGWLIAADPADHAGRAEILAEPERRQVLREWNDTSRELPASTMPELLEAQAARTPEAIAVTCGDAWLSYGELNARASGWRDCWRGTGRGRSRWWR